MSKKLILPLILFVSCSTQQTPPAVAPVEFKQEEVLLSSMLLQKIFDKEISPLACIQDSEEAALLLRTLRPRLEVIQDDLEAMLDDQKSLDTLIEECSQKCVCPYIDDLFREHQVILTKKQKKMMAAEVKKQETNKCLSAHKDVFCESKLYEALNKEKVDFSFDE